MSTSTLEPTAPSDDRGERSATAVWTRRFLVALTILAWVGLAVVALYLVHLLAAPVAYLIISALLAYILYPLVQAIQRVMPRPLAITLVFVALVGGLILLFVALVASLVHEISALVAQVQQFLRGESRQAI